MTKVESQVWNTGSVALPAGWNFHVGTVEVGDRRTSQKSESTFEVGAQDLQGARDAGFSGGGQPVDVGASAEDGARAQTDCLHDIGTTTDPAVEQDFRLPVNGSDDFRQDAKCRRGEIELASAVVGNHNPLSAGVDGLARVFGGEDAFDDDRTFPEIANPSDVVPEKSGTLDGGMRVTNA